MHGNVRVPRRIATRDVAVRCRPNGVRERGSRSGLKRGISIISSSTASRILRASSGSWSANNSIEPLRSANRMVTCLRSPSRAAVALGSGTGRCLSVADYVRGPAAPRGAPAAGEGSRELYGACFSSVAFRRGLRLKSVRYCWRKRDRD